ncbi:MAG: hypothetical protein A2231_13175 [Candidatus Firestonebacteria bacterium RIFOXYA2_FULL_40_8]|nr:MAG: hypothetical protein A2231_13175 [Candidatus Firestonebacteria bacterium RIFOXYA2_FULL_40_8]
MESNRFKVIKMVLATILFFTAEILACPEVTGITFSPSSPQPIGESVTASMVVGGDTAGGYEVTYQWEEDFSGVGESSDAVVLNDPIIYDAKATLKWTKDGESGENSVYDFIVAFAVDSVTVDKTIIAKGSTDKITATANLAPANTAIGDVSIFMQWIIYKDDSSIIETSGSETYELGSDNEAGKYKISAKAGEKEVSPWKKSEEIIVFGVVSETYVLKPANTDRKKLGIGEDVFLKSKPEGLSTVTWSISGDGTLSSDSGNTVTFSASETASSPEITASYGGVNCSVSFNVIEPSGFVMNKFGGTYHIKDIPSVGMRTYMFVTPDDVNFGMFFAEDIVPPTAKATCTGYFNYTKDYVHAPSGVEHLVVDVVTGKGNQLNGYDTAAMSLGNNFPTPFSAGTFTWSIPWYYKFPGKGYKKFITINQVFTIDATGKLTVSKAGASASANLNDPASGY